MTSVNTDFLFFLMLTLMHFALFILSIFRLKKNFNFVPSLRNSYIFYASIIIQLLLKVIADAIITAFNGKISLKEALLLLYIPTTLFILSYLLLTWQMLVIFTQAHLRDSGSLPLMLLLNAVTTSPKHSKVAGYMIFFLTIYIGMQTVLYFVYAGGKLSNKSLTREVLVSSLIFSTSVLILMIILGIKFSSVPIRSEV